MTLHKVGLELAENGIGVELKYGIGPVLPKVKLTFGANVSLKSIDVDVNDKWTEEDLCYELLRIEKAIEDCVQASKTASVAVTKFKAWMGKNSHLTGRG